MAFLEKSNWVTLLVAVPTVLLYLVVVVPQVLGQPIDEVAWVQPMIVTIVVFVVAIILGNIVAAAANPGEADMNDERDREIDRFGERVGTWLIVAGSLAALVLAMVGADHFWLAHAIFFGGLLGALLSSAAKIAAYHGSFQRW
jgi:hypothetical protein